MKKLVIDTDNGHWELRKPSGRDLKALMSMGIDPEDDQWFETMTTLVSKLVVVGPPEMMEDGKINIDLVPAEDFIELFFQSYGPTLKKLSKLQDGLKL